MLLTLNDLQRLGKVLDAARQASSGGRKSARPTFKKPHPLAGQNDPDYQVFEGVGHYCQKLFKTQPIGDPRAAHGRSQLGVDHETGEVRCVACERSL